jgi:hypothetical protein
MPGKITTGRKIDWQSIKIVQQQELTPNPRNPHAAASVAQREQATRDLARAILLRKAAGRHLN